MPYTNAWSDTIPLGTELASHIDDQIRQLRLDVHERMNALVVDWTTDPVVPIVTGGGATRIVPSALFTCDWTTQAPSVADYNGSTVRVYANKNKFFAPIGPVVKAGESVTRIEWLIDRQTVPTVNAYLLSTAFSLTPTPTVENTLTTSAGGLQIMDSGVLGTPIAITNAKYYVLELDPGTTGTDFILLYGVRLTIA